MSERYWRATPALCLLLGIEGQGQDNLRAACEEGTQLAYAGIECAEDEYRLGALFRQTRDDAGGWTSPDLVGDEGCVSPGDLLDEAARELASLPIAAPGVTVQPPGQRTLVNIETITYSTSDPQTFETTLLGIPVTIRATPDSYAWDYGDGSPPVVTDDPGAPYPDHTVGHTYDQPTDSVTISLDTTWTGQFQITGAPTWTDVPGTATTTSTAPSLQVLEAHSRLVTDPLG